MGQITAAYSVWVHRIVSNKAITRFVILGFIALTTVFGLCWALIDNEELSSWDPPGSDVELQRRVDNTFPQRNHIVAFILESKSGNVLSAEVLQELYKNELVLRKDFQQYLVDQYDIVNDRQIFGIFTMADAVQKTLKSNSNSLDIYTATEEQIINAVKDILNNDLGGELINSMSSDLRLVEDQLGNSQWVSSGMTIFVSLDNELLGGGRSAFSLSSDPDILVKETFNRKIQSILRGAENEYRLWGLAIDTNLEALDESQRSIPYVILAMLLVTLVAAVSLRSFKSFLVIGLGLIILLVWLEGISNILFLKQSVTTDLIVPIAMVSLGVDFFIHSVSRYNEARKFIIDSRQALAFAIVGISGALTLAMLSDGIAFLANLTSNIDAVVGFGFSAGIAVVSSYVVMGWIMPLVLVEIDDIAQSQSYKLPNFPKLGINLILQIFTRLENGILSISLKILKKPLITFVSSVTLTAACVLVALNIQPEFDIKDFFSSESDLVIGLDKLDLYMNQDLLGEPIYILAEIDSASITAIDGLVDLNSKLSKSEYVTKAKEGDLFFYLPSLDAILTRFFQTRYAVTELNDENPQFEFSMAETLNDINFSEGRLRVILDYIYENGVPVREETYYFEAGQIQEILQPKMNSEETYQLLISIGALGTREQSNVPIIKKDIQQILQTVTSQEGFRLIGMTGSPFIRSATLTHTTGLMKISVPLAIFACFIVLLIWMRSARYACVTVIPVAFAVFWILAFMVVAGLNVNFVTATIASVTIGVGIDFSIHITQRFRQEVSNGTDYRIAMERTIRGTGKALLGSALSSMIGFSVMILAPMPIIATYGLLTSIMICIATLGALFVLPSILLLVNPKLLGNK